MLYHARAVLKELTHLILYPFVILPRYFLKHQQVTYVGALFDVVFTTAFEHLQMQHVKAFSIQQMSRLKISLSSETLIVVKIRKFFLLLTNLIVECVLSTAYFFLLLTLWRNSELFASKSKYF